jgi:hypothetical protein
MYIGSNFQPLAHTAIAANRLTAFYFPLHYDSIWTPRVVRVVLLVITGLAIALGIGSFPILALTQCYCTSGDAYDNQMALEPLLGANFKEDTVSAISEIAELFLTDVKRTVPGIDKK